MTDNGFRQDKRVAVFHTHLKIGGVERVLINLLAELDKRGYEIDLLLVSDEGEFRSEVPEGVRTIELKRGRVPGIGVFASILPLARYLRRVEPDVLLSAKPNPNQVTVISQRLASVPTRTVVSFHGMTSDQIEYADEIRHSIKTELSKYVYPWAECIVAVSEGVKIDAAETLGIREEDISVIYNPVVTPELLRKSKQPADHPWFDDEVPVIIAAGRLHPHKNYSLLIKSFSLLREQMDARLVILGDGQTRPGLEALVDELGLESDVSLPGSKENPYPYMRQASVLVVSSVSEALPSTLIEAMACGCPVVSTNCSSGPVEILQDGEYGRLVPVNVTSAMAEAIISTLRNPPSSSKLKERAMDFTVEAITDEYEQVLFPEGYC